MVLHIGGCHTIILQNRTARKICVNFYYPLFTFETCRRAEDPKSGRPGPGAGNDTYETYQRPRWRRNASIQSSYTSTRRRHSLTEHSLRTPHRWQATYRHARVPRPPPGTAAPLPPSPAPSSPRSLPAPPRAARARPTIASSLDNFYICTVVTLKFNFRLRDDGVVCATGSGPGSGATPPASAGRGRCMLRAARRLPSLCRRCKQAKRWGRSGPARAARSASSSRKSHVRS